MRGNCAIGDLAFRSPRRPRRAVAAALKAPVDEAAAPVVHMDETLCPRQGCPNNWAWARGSGKKLVRQAASCVLIKPCMRPCSTEARTVATQ
jgi:hypothetical protein